MPLAFAEPGYDRIADSIAAAATPKESGNDGTTVCNSTVWRTIRGDTADTRRMMQRIRELGETAPVAAYPMVGRFHVCPLFLGALLERGNAGAKAVMLDSLAALLNSGVGLQYPGNVATLYVARWLEEQGKYAAALQMIRRRPYIHNPAFYLALPAHLRQEGRLAALAGDTAGAIRAYRQFLTLRDQPDPGIRLMEVQQARTALDSLLGSRSKQRTARAR